LRRGHDLDPGDGVRVVGVAEAQANIWTRIVAQWPKLQSDLKVDTWRTFANTFALLCVEKISKRKVR